MRAGEISELGLGLGGRPLGTATGNGNPLGEWEPVLGVRPATVAPALLRLGAVPDRGDVLIVRPCASPRQLGEYCGLLPPEWSYSADDGSRYCE